MTNNVDDHSFVRSQLQEHKSLIDQTNERFSISEPELEDQFGRVYKLLDELRSEVMSHHALPTTRPPPQPVHFDINTPPYGSPGQARTMDLLGTPLTAAQTVVQHTPMYRALA